MTDKPEVFQNVSDPARFRTAILRFDAVNSADPNREMADGEEHPRELLYARRLCAWVLTQIVRDLRGLEGPGPLPVGHLRAAHALLFAEGDVSTAGRDAARATWARRRGKRPQTLDFLLSWAA